MAKLLLVEDDRDLAMAIEDRLNREHYLVEVVHDGAEALHRLKSFAYDAVILDWNLPDTSGIAIVQELRQSGGKTPVLLLTARGAVDDKERGFDAGADDYLTKPFEPRELSARIRSLIRRGTQQTSNLLKAGPFTLDPQNFTVFRNEQELKLQPKEFALLELFLRHPGETFSHDALLSRVWASDADTNPDTIRVYVATLRGKIDDSERQSYIETVFRRGYKFNSNPERRLPSGI